MSWFRPSGGLIYHWRAHRHRQRWQPFRDQVAQWLKDWPQSSRQLILIGSSGGYTLPRPWLERFDVIHAFDVDPWAKIFFKLQHPRARVQHKVQDMFWRNGSLTLEPLELALKDLPEAAILFSNVIGQVLLEHAVSETEWSKYLVNLRQRLSAREWASYHDRLSITGDAGIDHLTDGPWLEGLVSEDMEWRLTHERVHKVRAVKTSPVIWAQA